MLDKPVSMASSTPALPSGWNLSLPYLKKIFLPILSTFLPCTTMQPATIKLASRSLASAAAASRCNARIPSHTFFPRPSHLQTRRSRLVFSPPAFSVVRTKATLPTPSPAERVGGPGPTGRRGKLWKSADEAIQDVRSGSLILSAGASKTSTLLKEK